MPENKMSNVLYKFSKQRLVGLTKVKVTILAYLSMQRNVRIQGLVLHNYLQ